MEFSFQRSEKLFYRQQQQQLFSRATTDIRVRAIRDFRDEVHEITRVATNLGAETARSLAPRGGPNTASSKNERSRWGKIKDNIGSSTEPVFAPGGAGGGGSWQARIYVNTDPIGGAPHALFQLQGTGIYGEKDHQIEYGKVISFFWHKAGIFWHNDHILGTPVQREWWDRAHEAMEEYLRHNLDEIHVRGVANRNP